MSSTKTEALVATAWLGDHLGDDQVRVVDGSWYLPQQNRDPRAEFADAHLPGARFFDIDAISDANNPLPHMLPAPEAFGSAVGTLGIGNADHVIAYDGGGLMSAARVWWMFRVFGHDRVSVLDGGLPKWRAEARAIESGVEGTGARRFEASPFRAELVRSVEQMRTNLDAETEQVVDARSYGRFTGSEPEVRPGLRSGHIPNSRNVPFTELFLPDGTMWNPDDLRRAFEHGGVSLDRPITTSCGSGITAAVLALGLHVLDHEQVALYDGSWVEWGGRTDLPIER